MLSPKHLALWIINTLFQVIIIQYDGSRWTYINTGPGEGVARGEERQLLFKVHKGSKESQISFKYQVGNLMNKEARFKRARNGVDSEVYMLCIKDSDSKSLNRSAIMFLNKKGHIPRSISLLPYINKMPGINIQMNWHIKLLIYLGIKQVTELNSLSPIVCTLNESAFNALKVEMNDKPCLAGIAK